MSMTSGVPSKLVKEFTDRKISVECTSGEIYRGVVRDVEENLSVSLNDVKATLVSGKVVKMEGVYVRGNRIRLISLPNSAADYMPQLTRPSRGRGGFRGSRGGRSSYGRR